MKARFSTTVAAALCALACFGAAPRQPAEGVAVSAIKFSARGNAPIDETYVRSFLSLKEGDAYSAAALASDVRALLDSKRFAFVNAAAESTADGVELIYSLEGRVRLADQPTFDGASEFSRATMRKKTGLKPGDFVDDSIVAAAAARLRDLYAERRYFDAKVTPFLSSSAKTPGAAYLEFRIDEGKCYHVDFLEFKGASAITQEDLGRLASLHDWYNPVSWVTRPRVSDADLDMVRDDAQRQYLDAGYLDASVSAPKKRRAGDRISVSYDVAEGRVYRISRISLEGVTLFPVSAVGSSIALRPGDPAGAAAMDDARTAVQEYYASRGYPGTRVRPSTVPGPDNTLALTLHVTEGPLVKVRDVVIRGNTITKDKVLRREIGVAPGDVYDTVRAERSKRRLMNLGYFEDVRLYDTAAGENLVDVHYDVDEQSTGRLTFGAGFSSVDHVIGIFGISQSNFDIFGWRNNFRGAGQKARIDLTLAEDSTDLDASFVEPWFLDRRLALDVDVFIKNRDYTEYEERRIGGSVGIEKMVPWIGRVGLSYNLTFVTLDDVVGDPMHLLAEPEQTYSYLDEDDDYKLASLRLFWLYDTRDNAIVPHRGARANASFELYNGAFGSDYDFYQVDLKAYKYFSLPFGFLLSLSGRLASVDTMGDDDIVPIGSRFFLGGGRYVRGFRHRAIGPKATYDSDPTDYGPVGGKSLFWATAELSVPLFENIRFATFYDIGNVCEDSFDFDFGSCASSVGAGLRFDFVGFPIRLDYAHVLDRDDEISRTREFVFWIGFDN